MAERTRASQWREAANSLREFAAKWDDLANDVERTERLGICGVVSNSGAEGEPLACGFPVGHEGKHAWATLPTFIHNVEAMVRKAKGYDI